MKHLKLILLLLLFPIVWYQCKTDTKIIDQEERKIQIVYTDWAENIALTHLAQYLLTEKLGYEVVIKKTTVAAAYHEIGTSKSDIFMDAWLPVTHKKYLQQYKDTIENLGPVYPLAKTGFAVPEYMSINTIEDLRAHYQAPITGIDSGAGIMQSAYHAIELYQLPNSLLTLSGPEMSKRFEEAYKRREPIVITGWEPHWLFHRHELKFLKDSKKAFPEQEQITILGRKGFTKQHPHASLFFERMSFTEKEMNELVFAIQKQQDPVKAVEDWANKHAYLVNIWLRDLAPERLKIM